MRRVLGALAAASVFGSVPAAAIDMIAVRAPAPETVSAAVPDTAPGTVIAAFPAQHGFAGGTIAGPAGDAGFDTAAARNLRAFAFAAPRPRPPAAPAPEPFNWLLLVTGFTIVGLATRGRRTPPPVVA